MKTVLPVYQWRKSTETLPRLLAAVAMASADLLSNFFSRDPEEFEKNRRKTTEPEVPEDKPKLFNPEVLQAPPKKRVAVADLAQLSITVLAFYTAIVVAVLIFLQFYMRVHMPDYVPAYHYGLGYGLFLGLSWALGAILSANSSPAVKLLATVALSPARFLLVLLGIIFFAQQFQKSTLISHHVLFLIGFQVFNHGLQIYVNYHLDRRRTVDPEDSVSSAKSELTAERRSELNSATQSENSADVANGDPASESQNAESTGDE